MTDEEYYQRHIRKVDKNNKSEAKAEKVIKYLCIVASLLMTYTVIKLLML